jgi:predicted transcriptional regulator of viral defense system
MSTRKNVLALLMAAEKAQTYDELLAAVGTTRHGLSNALSALRLAGIVETVPATFFVSDQVRAELKRKAMRSAAESARLARARQDRAIERKRLKKAEAARAHEAMLPVQSAPRSRVPANVPSSVFDMARVMGVAA